MSVADKYTVLTSEKIPKVYEAGYTKGKAEGGTDSYYDTAWDSIKEYTDKNGFERCFMGKGWNDTTFKPKYDIVLKPYSRYAFQYSGIKNLKACLDDRGKKIDFTNAVYIAEFFADSSFEHIGEVDFSTCINTITISGIFNRNSNLVTIEKIKLNDKANFQGNMQNCDSLQNIAFEGELKGTLNFQWCKKLSHDSIVDIINHLSSETSGLTLTLSLTAVKKAFETSEGANDGNTSAEWLALEDTRPNWTISLV